MFTLFVLVFATLLGALFHLFLHAPASTGGQAAVATVALALTACAVIGSKETSPGWWIFAAFFGRVAGAVLAIDLLAAALR